MQALCTILNIHIVNCQELITTVYKTPLKKSSVYHPRSRLNSRPHRIFFFYFSFARFHMKMKLIVVLSCKFKKHDLPGVWDTEM